MIQNFINNYDYANNKDVREAVVSEPANSVVFPDVELAEQDVINNNNQEDNHEEQ